MAKQSNKTIIGFGFSQFIETLHPDECFSVSYLGRAEITEDSTGAVEVRISDLWLGVEVPSKWQPYHFRKVAVPDSKPRFNKLVAELEQAAIDQFYSPVPVTLPDEVSELKDLLLKTKSEAMIMGELVHSLVLEPEKIVEAENPFQDQAWKDLCEIVKKHDKYSDAFRTEPLRNIVL